MRIDHDVRISPPLRGSSLGNFRLETVSISNTVLSASPTSISTSYVASEIQRLTDAVSEIIKMIDTDS